ncbi:MAG: radical SAM protein [Candidatus Pacearchaeota archaeon]|nr:radical SAM protein [Candidatus Pacearchaeota archaeon]
MIKKTRFDSYCVNGFAEGCKYCVQGRKLVLFISGKCSRNCWYCSLSNKRKNVDKIWANERECKNIKEMIEEGVASQSKGAGVTGGDPLLCLSRTIKFIHALKNRFGKQFHIHIYVPTDLVTEEKLRKLKLAGVDEIRFHPRFLDGDINKEVDKIKIASKFWTRQNIGIELPMFPGKIKETFSVIKAVSSFIGFVNLNELEISDTNFDYIIKKYKTNEDTYTIRGSKEAGLAILKECEKAELKLRVHFCTAKTKNLSQYKNRLKLRKILPFGFKTKEGSVKYFVVYNKDISNKSKKTLLRDFKNQTYVDNKNKRLILSEKAANQIIGKAKIKRVEEMPTWDAFQISSEEV